MLFSRCGVAAAFVVLALSTSAQAADVKVLPNPSSAIDYLSTAATANQLTVEPTATAGTYRVNDPAEALVPGAGCVAVDAHTVDCTGPGGEPAIRQMVVHLGDGIDTFFNNTALSCICYGEAGGDTMNGGDTTTGRDQLYGGPGADTLNGRAGGDTLDGEEDADAVNGGDGDDDLTGYEGDDTIDGGAGSDTVSYRFGSLAVVIDLPEPGATATGQGADGENDSLTAIESVTGSQQNDIITGNSQTNVLTGDGGDDILNGQGEFDVLSGSEGSDTLNGGPGGDFLQGDDGNDFLYGGDGDDSLQGDADFDFPGLPPTLDVRGNDLLDGEGGTGDTVSYTHRQSAVTAVLPATGQSTGNGDDGTAEDDAITATVERISGGAGNDTLTGNGFRNNIQGNNGDDTIDGGGEIDALGGGNGGDTIHGGDGADSVQGDAQFDATPGADVLFGDAQNDVLDGAGGGDTLNGGDNSDLLTGGPGGDTLNGDAGTDTLKGEGGDDVFHGGADADTVTYSSSTQGVEARLGLTALTTGNGAGTENDTIDLDVENLTGSDQSDQLFGGAGPNVVDGRNADDTIDVAGNGADTAICGGGNDTATATAGEDTVNADCENGGGGSTGDTTAPIPTVSEPAAMTSESAVAFAGSAGTEAGDLPDIEVTVWAGETTGGDPLFSLNTTRDAGGAWSVSRTTPLSAGKFTVVAFQSDSSGNTGHSVPRTFTVTAPSGGTPAQPAATPTPGPPPAALTGKAPALVTAISVGGKPRVGSIVTAEFGGWINGVYQFKVTWRVCDADGRSNCVPTKDSEKFTHLVQSGEKGKTFLFAVTASNSSGSTTRVSPPSAPAAGAPKMPDVTRKPMITVKKAGTLLRDAGVCTDADWTACGTRMPVDMRLDGVARDEVPKELRRTIESGEIFAQKPSDGTELEQGDRVKLSFYSTKADKPSTCSYANLSEAKVKKAFAGMLFSEAREKLQSGNCEHGWTVVGKDFALPERKVQDAKVDFNTRGGRFIQLMVIEPEPVNYKPVPQVDTDGDGIWDEWESKGVDANSDGSIDLDLPAMGADPRHKDLFVELDAMDNHPYDPAAASAVIAAFAAGSISNPDGKNGVTLHLDTGSDAVMNPKTAAKWGSRSQANSLTHKDVLGTLDGNALNWGEFQTVKTANFSPVRASVFRYVVNMHNHPKKGVTGTARDLPGEPTLAGASDVVIGSSNPCAAPDHCLLTPTEQAVNLMHEIGHLLGLGHGGRSAAGVPDHLNGKPNYLSIMSYSWSFTGVKIGDTFKVDFSPFPGSDEPAERRTGRPGTIMPLDESSLSELAIARATGAAGGYAFTRYCVDAGGKRTGSILATLNGAIDWNCKSGVETAAQSLSLNTDTAISVLRSYDDWSNMTFTGGTIGDFNMVLPTAEVHPVDEPTYEELRAAASVAHGDAQAPTVKARRSGRRLKITAADEKALSQVTVQVDRGTPKSYAATGTKVTRTVKLPRGRHRVLVRAIDVAGNRSKLLRVRSSGR